ARGVHGQLRLEALEEIALEARVDALVPGELAVIVDRRMKGLMRILNIVGCDGRKQDHVAWRVWSAAGEPLEGAPEVSELFLLAPRQPPDTMQHCLPELRERGAVLARQVGERIRAKLFHPEIDEVIRVIVPTDAAPRVRIDRADDDLGAVV